MKYLVYSLLAAIFLTGCVKSNPKTRIIYITEDSKSSDNKDVSKLEDWIKKTECEYYAMFDRAFNYVLAHNECDTIVGNFTGEGIDSLYVDIEVISVNIEMISGLEYRTYECKYFLKSNNPKIPTLELYGEYAPDLVMEGDVDGDGKDEWGYLHNWNCSQWRQYRIYNYDSKSGKWRHLYYDQRSEDADIDYHALLATKQFFRAFGGVEIVEKGPRPGSIKINYMKEYYCQEESRWKHEIKDTIVNATYTPIDENYW